MKKKNQFSLNGKAMNIIYCALDRTEFNRISGCETAKSIWDMLEVTHEGTSRVKDSKISILVHDYELFKMKQHESIKEMFTRFTDITNGLKALGRVYSNTDIVTKILRSLPRSWEAKVTAIREAKDMRTLPLEELLGSLMTYELESKRSEYEDEEKGRRITALKSTKKEKESNESEEDSNDEEFVLMAKKFKKYFNKRRNWKRRDYPRKSTFKGNNDKDKEREIICYECKKPGHTRPECPLRKDKKNLKKKKAMKVT